MSKTMGKLAPPELTKTEKEELVKLDKENPQLDLNSTALSVVKRNGKYELIKIKFDKRNLPNDSEVSNASSDRWDVQSHFNVAADSLFLMAEEIKDDEPNNSSK